MLAKKSPEDVPIFPDMACWQRESPSQIFFFFFFFLTDAVWNLAKCNARRLIPTPEIY